MKYFILLYFILFIPVIFSFKLGLLKFIKKKLFPSPATLLTTTTPPTTIPQTTTQSINTTKRPWQKWNITLNDTLVLRLGYRGVKKFNRDNKTIELTFINVTSAFELGDVKKGNREVKLIVMVSRIYKNKTDNSEQNICQLLRTVCNATKIGKNIRYKVERVKLFNVYVKGECKPTVNITEIEEKAKKREEAKANASTNTSTITSTIASTITSTNTSTNTSTITSTIEKEK
ncbi:Hypothetical protein SRAE_2000499710 [Strongyloides ratti]|uniref:Uncharacterized protein n=1 Tax=Strongyloides ratti TaxID=34506 RepID=A0A090MJU7_STRRB|nr:Hypothetical protein SRAE_2000499710 [Strongyloides ratti]CEG06144.1 Hypothetical protein SRAE_2000499710 [Strongyloides ratti]